MKKMTPSRRPTGLLALLLAGVLSSASAGSPSLWNGGGTDDNWSTPGNWGGNVPVPGSAYDLEFGGATRLTPYNDFIAGSFRHLTFDAAAGAFTLGGNSLTLYGHLTNNSPAAVNINLPFSTSAGRFVATPGGGSITFGGAISGTGGLNVVGPGSVTLAAPNTLTNYLYVNGGIFNITAGGAVRNSGYVFAGQNAGQSGAINITGGTLTNTLPANTTGSLMVGRAGYGALNLSSGTVKVNTTYIGWNSGLGLARVTGGAFYGGAGDYIVIGTIDGSTGVLTVDGTGLFYHATTTRPISLNNGGDARAELNVLGGLLNKAGGLITFGYNSPITALGTGSGVISLNGGVLMINRISNFSKNGIPGESYLNFNGGTLLATTNNPAVLPYQADTGSHLVAPLTGVYVNGPFGDFPGGAVIDTGGEDATVAAALLAPTGGGIRELKVVEGGSGYIGEPYVTILGDGVAATAVAKMADDGTGKGTLKVESVTICNPGVNYGAAYFYFNGGSPVVAASAGEAILGPNTSGGLTKNGAGRLTLLGEDTYSGPTVVNAGQLVVSTARAAGMQVTVADGASFGVERNPGTPSLMATSVQVGGSSGAGLEFVLPDGAPAEAPLVVGALTVNGQTTVRVSGDNFAVGNQFPLVKYTTLVGDPNSLLNGVLIAPAGTLAQLVHNVANSSFDLKITAVSRLLTWAGTVHTAGLGDWDNGITANWKDPQNNPKPFLSGAEALLDDTAAGVTGIRLVGELEATSVVVNNSTRNYLFGGSGALAGETPLTKTGGGKLTITNANHHAGATTIDGGVLEFAGSATNRLSGVSVQRGALVIGGNLEVSGDFTAGKTVGTEGAVNVTGGTLISTAVTGSGNLLIGEDGYGAFNQSGGVVKAHTAYFGSKAGTVVASLSGGTLEIGTPGGAADYILVGAGTGNGVLTVSGGLLNHANVNRTLSVNNNGNARGELNLLGGVIDNTGGGISYGYNTGAGTGAGVVNLNGGELFLHRFIAKKQTTGDIGLAFLNFNGGALRATSNSLTSPNLAFSGDFIPERLVASVNGAFGAFPGGAVIDTAGRNCTVIPGLLAPAGQGVRALAVASGGSGYVGAPYVAIQGDGAGAAAIANMADDGSGKGTLRVASITVCNPGVNYNYADYSLIGGGAAVPATPGAVTLGANTSGGLVKTGAGALSLNGINTYTGPTRIQGGLLQINGTLDPASAVTAAGGALGGHGIVGGPVAVESGGALAPGRSLTVNNSLTLAAGSTTYISVTATSSACDQVQGLTRVTYGGTLIVSNTAGALALGQTFSVFSAGAFTGNFASVQSADGSASWAFNPNTGELSVTSLMPTAPTNLAFSMSGNTLSLTWPEAYKGWQAQSNSISLSAPEAWFDIPGSATATRLDLQIDPAAVNVFYRLRLP